ncbi:MAG: RNA polymerase factor sigma-32 [Candidatus Alcyoniella australis]|nr:RNA polymerase factor sigma-32 [Candidatus Alcyoniella australis]
MSDEKQKATQENTSDDVEVIPPTDSSDHGGKPAEPFPTIDKKGEQVGLVSLTPLQRYLAEVRRFPLLTREQEKDLAVRLFEKNDAEAAYRLVVSNLRLVVKIAMDFRRAFVNVLDLIQEGNIGLMQAVSKYDPYRGTKLSSYAAWWIKAYILRYILNNWRMVKAGTTQAQRKLFYNLQKEKERLSAMGIEPSAQLIAKQLDVPTREVVEMEKRMERPEMSLDAPLSRDGSGTAMDLIPARTQQPDELVEKADQAQRVSDLLEEFSLTLNEKESFIYRNRMLAEDPMTLQEIGDEYDISRERVRQIEKKLMSKLKDFMVQNDFEY